MLFSSLPTKFQIPFANSSGNIRTIPQASQIAITAGAASLTDGFPPSCFLPVGAGGVPPWGADFNGLFNQITQWTQWQNAGGMVTYDATFSTAVTGYPNHALVASGTSIVGGLWQSIADANTNNPDTTSSPGNNWIGLGLNAKVPWFALQGATGAYGTAGSSTFTGPGGPVSQWLSNNNFVLNSTVSALTGSVTIGTQDAGTWVFSATVDGSVANNHFSFWINVNNTPKLLMSQDTGNVAQSISGTITLQVSAGQSVWLGVANSAGSGVFVNNPTTSPTIGSTFMGYRIGAL